MHIVLRYFEGCPNWETAEARLREALARAGTNADVDYELVATEEDAERLRFVGSPTILLDGSDPFLEWEPRSFGLSCRVYRTETGFDGSPSVSDLEQAIRDHAA